MIRDRLSMALVLGLTAIHAPEARAGSPEPVPSLTPAQVVEIQIEALQFNDRPSKDAGIATTFRFASPGNREVTGPLARFTQIVRGPAFLPLINHRVAGYGPIVVRGNAAARRVTVIGADGQATEYEFRLGLDGASGCWFTEGVIPLPPDAPIDAGKIARASQSTRSTLSE